MLPEAHILLDVQPGSAGPISEPTLNHPLIPAFSHIPPPHIKGTHCWPLSLDSQAHPGTTPPILLNILIWVKPYLLPDDAIKT